MKYSVYRCINHCVFVTFVFCTARLFGDVAICEWGIDWDFNTTSITRARFLCWLSLKQHRWKLQYIRCCVSKDFAPHHRSTRRDRQASGGHSWLLRIHVNPYVGARRVGFRLWVFVCIYSMCFTCYFSAILMGLQSARHFNRARERLVKHTHSPQDREERLAHWNMVVWMESVCVCVH